MSRSVRKTTSGGMHKSHTGASSEKEDKQLWHGALRTAYRNQLSMASANSDVLAISARSVSNVWDFAKDGLSYWSNRAQEKAALSSADRIVGNQDANEVAKLAERKLHKLRAK